MLKNVEDPKDLLQVLLSLLSTSGTLAGLSLALVGIVNLKVGDTTVETLADDMFLFASVGFLVVCYLVFFAMRRVRAKKVQYWANLIDLLFLASLTLLVMAGFTTLYAVLE
jgi:nitrate reductase gamma subunit